MIGVLSYGVGNTASIVNMLRKLGIPCMLVVNPRDMFECDRLILPGIGAFDVGMAAIRQNGFFEPLMECAMECRKPILGICLGAQMMTQSSDEGELPGLGFFDARTRRFDFSTCRTALPLPNIGWRAVSCIDLQKAERLPIESASRFYFVHNYHFLAPADEIWLQSEYGYNFACGLMKDNFVCTQFHPEKSHHFGFSLLKGFSMFTPSV